MTAVEPVGIGIIEPPMTPDLVRRVSDVIDRYEWLEAELCVAAEARLISWGLVAAVLREADQTVLATEHPTSLVARIGWRAP